MNRTLVRLGGALILIVGCQDSDPLDCDDCAQGGTAGVTTGGRPGTGGGTVSGGHGGISGGHGGVPVDSGGSAGSSSLPICDTPAENAALPWGFTKASKLVSSQLELAGGAGNGEGGWVGGAGAPSIAGGVGGEGGESAEPCVFGKDESVSCAGWARVERVEDTTQLVFADGSVLAYSAPLFAIPGPFWVKYHNEVRIDCPFCGSRRTQSVDVRDRESGQILLFGLAGEIAQTVPADVLDQVFGSPLLEVPECVQSFTFDCYRVSRTRLDFTVKTTPEQPLFHGAPTIVTSSSGAQFDVMISRSSDRITREENCDDGGEVHADSTFIASRRSDR